MDVGPVSPYAPGIVSDEPAALRVPERPTLFIAAAFVMALIGPGLLGPSWKAVLGALGIAYPTWHFHLLACAPALLGLFWGRLSDRWPIMGARRESYLVVAALAAAGTWLVPLLLTSPPLHALDACAMVAAHSLSGVAIGGALVEIGRRLGIASRLAAAWIGALAAADLTEIGMTSTIGGWLPRFSFCTGLAAAVAIALIVLPRKVPAPASAPPVPPSLRRYLRTPALWTWVTVLVLAAAASLPDAAIRRDGWAPPVRALMFAGQIAGAGAYALASRRLTPLRGARLALMLNLVVVIFLGRAADRMGPVIAAGVLGLLGGFKFAALTDVTLRVSPPWHEAFVCALCWAAFQIGSQSRLVLRDVVGMYVSDVTTVATVVAVAAIIVSGLLPASLVARPEAEPSR